MIRFIKWFSNTGGQLFVMIVKEHFAFLLVESSVEIKRNSQKKEYQQ